MHHVSELFLWDALLLLIAGSDKWLSKNLTRCNIRRGAKSMVDYGEYKCKSGTVSCQDRNQRHVQIVLNPQNPKYRVPQKLELCV